MWHLKASLQRQSESGECFSAKHNFYSEMTPVVDDSSSKKKTAKSDQHYGQCCTPSIVIKQVCSVRVFFSFTATKTRVNSCPQLLTVTPTPPMIDSLCCKNNFLFQDKVLLNSINLIKKWRWTNMLKDKASICSYEKKRQTETIVFLNDDSLLLYYYISYLSWHTH